MPTITIPLTQGKETVIDAEDWPRVSAHKWYAQRRPKGFYVGSAVRFEDGQVRYLRLHRFILNAAPGTLVDHIDGDTLNNTRANLRMATVSQNAMNMRPKEHTQSRYKGVIWHRDRKQRPWEARITCEGKTHLLGRFITPEEAALVYDAKARVLHGPFARLNFPD